MYIYIYINMHTYIHTYIHTYACVCVCLCVYGGCLKIMVPQNCPCAAFRKPCALFRAAAKSIHGIMIMLSCVFFV